MSERLWKENRSRDWACFENSAGAERRLGFEPSSFLNASVSLTGQSFAVWAGVRPSLISLDYVVQLHAPHPGGERDEPNSSLRGMRASLPDCLGEDWHAIVQVRMWETSVLGVRVR